MVLVLFVLLAQVAPAASVVLDPGHTPSTPGARSAAGQDEVGYNDRLAAALAARLGDLPTSLTRQPGMELTPGARLAAALAARPALVLSLHHDSVQPGFLEPASDRPVCSRFRGFSLFVSWQGRRPQIAFRLARRLSRALREDGRVPTEHHAMPIPGEGRPWLDRPAGIHEGSYIRLVRELAQADVPAVLLEAGVLVHPEEERLLADPRRIEDLASALASAIRAHLEAEAALRRLFSWPGPSLLAPWAGYRE
ncbi:MAG TPA: N-acetylmuramoyl-L-alanine amidase [Myxococcota bacterium]|nr:N-acetylmuramoyl-L-alanine amidase [Myxococcota bacterium]HRY93395.1 N-acetylmuramoyl-L-alanine amidase [Myxococcota bacterium]HSA20383.1 N-acetylmuramoyl-L-alanine amidase [Myxococcota bacterium]